MVKRPKDRHAKVNFNNWGSPPVGLPEDASPVTFVRDTQGNIRAYAEAVAGPAGPAGTSESELWAAPASADSFDDEFTANSLSGSWTLYDADGSTTITPSGTIDPYTSFASGAKVQTNTYRRSWLAAQVKNTDSDQYLMKSYTPNTNDVIWCRLGHTLRPSQQTNDATVVLMLMAATAGHPDPANRLGIWWVPNSGAGNFATRMFIHKTTAGVGADVYTPTAYITENAYAKGTYFLIQKRSTNYDCWILDGIGTHYWLGTTTFAPTIAYAGFMFHDATSVGTKPGNAIFSADFIRRVQNTSVFLP